MSEPQRKLAAIMFTDMVGYTALGQRNEPLSLALVMEQRNLVRPILSRHGGREIKTIGDAFLVEFPSALEAVRCAYDIQRAVREFDLSLPDEKRVHLRVGIHLGDVVDAEGDISGDAVNVASRIEQLAEDGGVCLTRQVYDHVLGKFDLELKSLGTKALKNVGVPIEVFKMLMPWNDDAVAQSAVLNKRRIAVLPFANLSSDPEEGYFADGMTEEIITSLSGVRNLTVIARTSVMQYKNTKRISDISKELSVGTLIEGSVRKAGNKIRITAQLIDTETEGHLWAQNYDRQLEDVFAIQSEIAEKVASELKIRVVEAEKRVIEKKPTESTGAYTLYLQGRELMRAGTELSTNEAIEIFERSIKDDEYFAKAYAGLAECFIILVSEGYEPFEKIVPKAELSARKAVQLDPELAEAHATLAFVFFMQDEVVDSQSEAVRAKDLNPSLPEPYFILATLNFQYGDISEGITAMERCYHLDPVRPRYINRLGRFYFYLGMESKAQSFWQETIRLDPAGTFRSMTEYYLHLGNTGKAMECYLQAKKLEPTNRWVEWMGGFIAASMGDKDGALQAINRIEEKWIGSTNLNDIGFVFYGLGDFDSYFKYMNSADDAHTLQYIYPMLCPLFKKGREDPRYQELVEKVRSRYRNIKPAT